MSTETNTIDAHAGEDHKHEHHVCSAMSFVGILVTLLFLTFITVWISQFDFGAANMLIAMAIAAVKATLVMSVFMHMIWDTTVNKLFFLSSFLFLGLLFLFAFIDLFARGDLELKHDQRAPLSPLTEMQEFAEEGSATNKYFKQYATPAKK